MSQKVLEQGCAVSSLFADLGKSMAGEKLGALTYPWEALPQIGDWIREIQKGLSPEEYEIREGEVYIAKSAKIYPNTYIAGPTIIGPETEVRPGAFIRGNALVGKGCVVGNSTELKNVILFDGVQVPHYNYVGDSILGYKAHMGAGSITSNVKADKTPVCVKYNEASIATGFKKFGAMLGDSAEIGCNTVMNPGTVIGSHSNVYPVSMVRGYVPAEHIYKRDDAVFAKK